MNMISHFDAPTLPRDIQGFLVELWDRFGPEVSGQWRRAFEAIDREGDHNGEAVKMFTALGIIVSRPRPFYERLGALEQVLSLPKGPTVVRIKLGAD
jgi:hypothetical protein